MVTIKNTNNGVDKKNSSDKVLNKFLLFNGLIKFNVLKDIYDTNDLYIYFKYIVVLSYFFEIITIWYLGKFFMNKLLNKLTNDF